jgi:hypothetical protein
MQHFSWGMVQQNMSTCPVPADGAGSLSEWVRNCVSTCEPLRIQQKDIMLWL